MKHPARLLLSFATILLTLCCVASPMSAQPSPRGNDFQVNVSTGGNQVRPAVATDDEGNAIITWTGSGSVFGRQIFANGAVNDEFFVSFGTEADIGRADDGSFVVSYITGGTLRATAFTALGIPQGSEILIDSDVGALPLEVSMDSRGNGDFVVAWAAGTGGRGDIFARQIDSDGLPLGDAFQVNTYGTGAQQEADVAVADNGDFVVTWTSRGSPGDDQSITSIQGRIYGSDGQPLTGQFQVNEIGYSRQDTPAVDWLDDGNIVFTWADISGEVDTDSTGISMQRTDVAGQPVGPWTAVNTHAPGRQKLPDVAALDDGGFVIVWESDTSPEDDSLGLSIQGQAFDSQGVPSGGQFQVNSFLPTSQTRVAVAGGIDRNFLVTWQSQASPEDDQDGSSVQARRFGPLMPEVFGDGFESGDTTSWSESQP